MVILMFYQMWHLIPSGNHVRNQNHRLHLWRAFPRTQLLSFLRFQVRRFHLTFSTCAFESRLQNGLIHLLIRYRVFFISLLTHPCNIISNLLALVFHFLFIFPLLYDFLLHQSECQCLAISLKRHLDRFVSSTMASINPLHRLNLDHLKLHIHHQHSCIPHENQNQFHPHQLLHHYVFS